MNSYQRSGGIWQWRVYAELLIMLLGISFTFTSARAAEQPFYIKLTVQATTDEDVLLSQISRQMRKLPNVEIISSNEDYGVVAICAGGDTGSTYACSITFDRPDNIDFWKAYVKPGDSNSWASLADLEKKNRLLLHQEVFQFGSAKVEWFASQVADAFNGHVLENVRQLRSTIEHNSQGISTR